MSFGIRPFFFFLQIRFPGSANLECFGGKRGRGVGAEFIGTTTVARFSLDRIFQIYPVLSVRYGRYSRHLLFPLLLIIYDSVRNRVLLRVSRTINRKFYFLFLAGKLPRFGAHTPRKNTRRNSKTVSL